MKDQRSFLTVNYKVIRKNRKTIGIKVTDEGEVIVTSPFGISDKIIQNIIKGKEEWILGKVKLMQENEILRNKEIKNGSKFRFLGRKLELEIIEVENIEEDFQINNGKIRIFVSSRGIVRDKIDEIYRIEAKKILCERTNIYSKIIGVKPNKIFIKNQKTLWGSCSSRKNINYNYRIIMAPIEIVDYIVVHELCHLIHMNHSKNYWNTVGAILPDYKERRNWLKSNGHTLKI
ncbi:M48 family metallopeptidase [Clostridiaceae bacterium UIB06]|uniref:M48 family metallopeptidase n=1 Tax=Clostridium thailandense TaxID=2794346 RepID=A0A949X537_9CLOT|nr:SprT family zinc-dependent metalloprotease [Clostridium thailandense]MBV7274998.1 M48 family metallopeptidase [Clostridium thailandense]MCH5137917.1 M48 family metallopeptidase [Clostridiaceae bacterium UIB06]